jgi:hypothetical protein
LYNDADAKNQIIILRLQVKHFIIELH